MRRHPIHRLPLPQPLNRVLLSQPSFLHAPCQLGRTPHFLAQSIVYPQITNTYGQNILVKITILCDGGKNLCSEIGQSLLKKTAERMPPLWEKERSWVNSRRSVGRPRQNSWEEFRCSAVLAKFVGRTPWSAAHGKGRGGNSLRQRCSWGKSSLPVGVPKVTSPDRVPGVSR